MALLSFMNVDRKKGQFKYTAICPLLIADLAIKKIMQRFIEKRNVYRYNRDKSLFRYEIKNSKLYFVDHLVKSMENNLC